MECIGPQTRGAGPWLNECVFVVIDIQIHSVSCGMLVMIRIKFSSDDKGLGRYIDNVTEN